jgi:hypothetical protein
MSERYGSPGELQEAFESLEDMLTTALGAQRMAMTTAESVAMCNYYAGKVDTIRDVLEFIVVNPGG